MSRREHIPAPEGAGEPLFAGSPARAAAGLAGAAVFLGLSGWLVTGPLAGEIGGLDSAVREFARSMHSEALTELFRRITRFGSTLWLTVAGGAAFIGFLVLKWWRTAAIFLVLMAGQALLHHGFKFLLARDRPDPLVDYPIGDSYGFPSGHALASLAVYGSIAWIFGSHAKHPGLRIALLGTAGLLVLLIGLSRIYLGVHHVSDVIAGWAAALIWTISVLSWAGSRRDADVKT